MHQFPGDPNDPDALRRAIENLNRQDPTSPNGRMHIVPPGIKPRPSGWRCPKCNTVADQRADHAPGTITGVRWAIMAELNGDETDTRPSPVAVVTREVIERDSEGNVLRTYQTIHCLNCFNEWQRRKMMEDLRANVPQLEYVGNDDADSVS